MNRIKLLDSDKCTGCAACASICPTHSITMKEDTEGFLQPRIDKKTCIGCHKCQKTCPILNKEPESSGETKAFAAINKDDAIRAKSSSGGVFYALAKWTIERQGVVFGARFDDHWEVMHDYAETLKDIEPFMGSKYIQSRIGETYKLAKSFLENGRWVLFSGTPCQLGGLRAFLGEEYERLIQVDLICYGVPSPKVWREYLKCYSKKNGKIVGVTFRDKHDGWNHYKCVVSTDKNIVESEKNLFIKGFFKDIYLRNSCYNCRFRSVNRNTDITIADYWGVEKHYPKMFDNKGTSIVFSHSGVGDRVLSEIIEDLCLAPQSIENAIEFNPCINRKNPNNDKRKRFFRLYKVYPLDRAIDRIDKDTMIVRAKRKMKKMFKN